MFVFGILFDTLSNNLLLGNMPESLGVLLFGIVLIGTTFGLRRFTDEKEGAEDSAVDISM